MNSYVTHLTNGMRLKVKATNAKGALMKSVLFHPYMNVKG